MKAGMALKENRGTDSLGTERAGKTGLKISEQGDSLLVLVPAVFRERGSGIIGGVIRETAPNAELREGGGRKWLLLAAVHSHLQSWQQPGVTASACPGHLAMSLRCWKEDFVYILCKKKPKTRLHYRAELTCPIYFF